MTPEFAKAVDPVFEYVLELLDRLEARQETVSGEREHQRIIRALDLAEASLGAGNEDWMAAKFALTCWTDEMLSAPIWDGSEDWKNNLLERELFGTADRALLFYTGAKKAVAERRRDALEVYYVCVILGFRGLYELPAGYAGSLIAENELPATLNDWLSQTGTALQLRRVPPVTPTGNIPRGAPEMRGYPLLMASLLALIAAGTLAGLAAAWAWH